RVMAIRAASSWRFVTQAASIDLRPKSPNWTRVCPFETPARRPRCCLRYFVFLGSNISLCLPTHRAWSGLRPASSAWSCPARLPLRGDALEALGHDLALVDPDLDADAAEGRLRLDEAVVDVCADRVQRDAPLGVALGTAHLGAAEPTAALHLHAVGTGAHRGG